MDAIEGDVGLAVETTEGTAPISPDLSLFMLKGNTPNLEIVEDQKFARHAFNEKHPRGQDLIRFHAEGDGTGLLFAPDNGIPQQIKAALGTNWISSIVSILPVTDGTKFKRNDVIAGGTSKARAEVVHVDTSTTPDNLWIVDVQGTFSAGEDLLKFVGATPAGADDYLADVAALSTNTAVTGYYAHRLSAMKFQKQIGTVQINTVATFAAICDPMVDFRKFESKTGRRRCKIVAKDAAVTGAISIEGWLGEAVMCIGFKTQTVNFTVGKTLSAQTGAGTARVIGVILGQIDNTATGTLYVTVSATATPVLDGDVLTDTTAPTPGAAVADQPVMPAYLYNACMIYRYNESADTTMTWNGDYTTFDETDVLTYKISQKIFDQTSLAYYVKNAGDIAMVGNGMHIKDMTFNASNKDYTYKSTFVGRTLAYPTTRPAFPGGLTTKAPYGAGSRTLEIDSSLTDPAATYILSANFGITFTISVDKGMTVDQHYPTHLEPNAWGATGSLEVQFRSNSLLRESWGGVSVNGPTPGAKITKRIFMLLENGQDVVTGYKHRLDIGMMGTVDKAAISRADDGYVLPVTLEAVCLTDESGDFNWAPMQFVLFDGNTSA